MSASTSCDRSRFTFYYTPGGRGTKEADEARPIAMVKKWPIVTVKRDLLQE